MKKTSLKRKQLIFIIKIHRNITSPINITRNSIEKHLFRVSSFCPIYFIELVKNSRDRFDWLAYQTYLFRIKKVRIGRAVLENYWGDHCLDTWYNLMWMISKIELFFNLCLRNPKDMNANINNIKFTTQQSYKKYVDIHSGIIKEFLNF